MVKRWDAQLSATFTPNRTLAARVACNNRVRRIGSLPKAGFRAAHDFWRIAVRSLERAGAPSSTAMRIVGHKTESIYRRYAIVDEAMMREGADKLAALHEAQRKMT